MAKDSVGGNAVLNGINFKCRALYIKVRRKNDKIFYTKTHYSSGSKIKDGGKQSLKSQVRLFLATTPFLRGIYSLFTNVKRSWKMAIAMYLIFTVFLVSLLTFSPSAHNALVNEESTVAYLLLGGGFLALFFLFLYLSPLAKYHGAEHKAINTIEAGEMPTLENIKKASRVSRRCGTIYVTIFILLFGILGVFMNEILAFFIATSVGYELFISEQKWLVNLLSPIVFLAVFIQKYLTTREPDEEQLKVAQLGIWHIKSSMDLAVIREQEVN